jgi:hypothetical protein
MCPNTVIVTMCREPHPPFKGKRMKYWHVHNRLTRSYIANSAETKEQACLQENWQPEHCTVVERKPEQKDVLILDFARKEKGGQN